MAREQAYPEIQSKKELRIGLVLYGGVSLAVYMNGVVTEVWNLLRGSKAFADKAAVLDGTAGVYQRFLNEILLDSHIAIHAVVDTIAGSSAGGVNGAALAKAIVLGADATLLSQVWVEDADIANLRDEPAQRMPWYARWPSNAIYRFAKLLGKVPRSSRPLPGITWRWMRDQAWSLLKSKDPARTPLKGDFFAQIIARTLTRMVENKAASLIPPSGSFDLFLTQTDLYGWPRYLPLSCTFHEMPVWEQTHAHRLHMRADATSQGDFAVSNGIDRSLLPLTVAARSTASFPFAFAPVTALAIRDYVWPLTGVEGQQAVFNQQLAGLWQEQDDPPLGRFHRKYLAEQVLSGSADPGCSWMADGGILDNRPFSHVIDAIENKPAESQVTRVIAYLEPDPEDAEAAPAAVPAVNKLGGALMRMLRYEPILLDLERVRERNTRVKQLAEMAKVTEQGAIALVASLLQPWSPPSAGSLAKLYAAAEIRQGEQFGVEGYKALARRRAIDALADAMCVAFDYPVASQQAFLVRTICREQLAGADVLAFDLPYRSRQLRHLVRQVNGCYKPLTGRSPGSEAMALRVQLDALKKQLSDAARSFGETLVDTAALSKLVKSVLDCKQIDALHDALTAHGKSGKGGAQKIQDRYGAELKAVRDALCQHFTLDAQWTEGSIQQALSEAARRIASIDVEVARHLCAAYLSFPLVDLVLFPVSDAAGVRDLVETQVLRISPKDGKLLSDVRESLAGREMGAFYGFFDKAARENDLLWGRLDGAERMVDMLAHAAGLDEQRRDCLRREILLAVLREVGCAKDASWAIRQRTQCLREYLAQPVTKAAAPSS